MGEGLTILDWKARLSDCERLTLRGTDSMIERTKGFFELKGVWVKKVFLWKKPLRNILGILI